MPYRPALSSRRIRRSRCRNCRSSRSCGRSAATRSPCGPRPHIRKTSWSAASLAAATSCSTRRMRSIACWWIITGNYRRSPASIRILRPITGKGLLLSEGEDWRHQRRTIAPALAPRNLPMLARHIVTCAQEAVAALTRRPASRWICWRRCRTWRWISRAARCSRWRCGNMAPRCAGCSPNTACATRNRICSTWCCRRRSRRCAISAAGGSSAHGWR